MTALGLDATAERVCCFLSAFHSKACCFRAMEKVPRKGKEFDPAEAGGHNLLEEMSLIELRQRLAAVKQRHQVLCHAICASLLHLLTCPIG